MSENGTRFIGPYNLTLIHDLCLQQPKAHRRLVIMETALGMASRRVCNFYCFGAAARNSPADLAPGSRFEDVVSHDNQICNRMAKLRHQRSFPLIRSPPARQWTIKDACRIGPQCFPGRTQWRPACMGHNRQKSTGICPACSQAPTRPDTPFSLPSELNTASGSSLQEIDQARSHQSLPPERRRASGSTAFS